METDTEDEEWEDSPEEDIEEYGEEVGEYLPPGYEAAEGPFKSYCTCKDFVTCSFCSWFYKIKECQRHGQATRRPFKPCTCPKDDEEKLPSLEELKKSLESLKGAQLAPVRTCVCVPKVPEAVRCDCLDFLEEKPPKDEEEEEADEEEATDVHGILGDYEEETGESETEVFDRDFGEEDKEWVAMEDEDGTLPEKPEKTYDLILPDSLNKKEDKTCTCETHHPPRSLSSTELETDSASTTTSGSFEDLNVGEGFPDDDDSIDLTPSEESSAESAAFDPTKIKWISNASDRSVDSITEDELDEGEIDKIAAHWGIRNIYGRSSPATKKLKEQSQAKPPKTGQTHQYLLVQHNRNKVFKKTCKKKKNDPKPYYYKLMEL